jgi:biotin-(acetyl-CoA carboxylase) ligase
LASYRERDALAGRDVTWSGGSGRARGIDGEGRLVLELEGGGRTALSAGEVHLQTPGR